MRKLIATMALLVLIAGPAAFAQTGANKGSAAGSANPSTPAAGKAMAGEAPVGHRQPHAGDVPLEQNLSDPNNPVNREDAALDRRLRSICRGC